MINIRLDPALWQRAKAAAGERGTTLERWVTEALEAALARQKAGESNDGAGPPVSNADLAWRVAALEQAVDYLASAIGAGLPGGGAAGWSAASGAPCSLPTGSAAEAGTRPPDRAGAGTEAVQGRHDDASG